MKKPKKTLGKLDLKELTEMATALKADPNLHVFAGQLAMSLLGVAAILAPNREAMMISADWAYSRVHGEDERADAIRDSVIETRIKGKPTN